jgi:hypothetical protein
MLNQPRQSTNIIWSKWWQPLGEIPILRPHQWQGSARQLLVQQDLRWVHNRPRFKESAALLQTIDCRKAWGKQPTGTEQGSPYCSVWNSHKFQARIQQPICRTNHVTQQFSCLSLDNGTERWRKAVLDNLWRSHIDRHWLASIWSVGSRWLSQKQPFAIWR